MSRDVDNKDNILTLRLADVGEDQVSILCLITIKLDYKTIGTTLGGGGGLIDCGWGALMEY